jgi:signal transduction histidine kinase
MGVHEIEVFYPRNRLLTFYMVPHPSDEDENGLANEQYTLIFQDVTAQRHSTEAVIESEKVEAITQLAAGVAHEIGNPLNSLTIHLQLLSRALDHGIEGEGLQDARRCRRFHGWTRSRTNFYVRSGRRCRRWIRCGFRRCWRTWSGSCGMRLKTAV